MSKFKTERFTGCLPSPEDPRNYVTDAIYPADERIPPRFEWAAPYTGDQGAWGTCVGFGGKDMKDAFETKEGGCPAGGFSPLFMYTVCKKVDGLPAVMGTDLKSAMTALYKYGAVSETDMPYNSHQLFPLPTITDALLKKAEPFKIAAYAVCNPVVNEMRRALTKSPLLCAVQHNSEIERPMNGFIHAPASPIDALHCILIVGYDDVMEHDFGDYKAKGFFKIQNSRGTSWGAGGFAYISYRDYPSYHHELWSAVDIVAVVKKYWKVQLGAYREKKYCEALVKKVKAAGFPTYMPPLDEDGYYRVQTGAFEIKENAYALRDTLRAADFKDAFVVYK